MEFCRERLSNYLTVITILQLILIPIAVFLGSIFEQLSYATAANVVSVIHV